MSPRQPLQLRAGQHLAAIRGAQADLRSDRGRGEGVVAGDHLHRDARPPAGRHRLNRLRAGRIDHPLQAEQGEVADVLVAEAVASGQVCPGEGQDPQSGGRHAVGRGAERIGSAFPRRAVGRQRLAAAVQQALGRAFDIYRPARVQGGHVLVLRIERDRIQPPRVRRRIDPEAGLAGRGDQCALGRIPARGPAAGFGFQAGVVAQQSGQESLPHGGVGLPAAADPTFGRVSRTVHGVGTAERGEFLHRHLVLGERPGFIRTDHRRRAECFHRRKVAEDRPAPGHAGDSDGEGDRDRGGKALGDRTDRQSHRRHHGIHERPAARHADRERRGGQHQNRRQQDPAEAFDLLRQRGLNFGCGGDQPRDAPDFRAVADRRHDAAAGPVRHQGRGVRHGAALGQHGFARTGGRGVLLHRRRLSGQRGFGDLQAAGVQEAQVGRDPHPGLQQDDVPRDQILGRDPPGLAGAHDLCFGGHRPGQRGDRFLRAGLLDVSDDRVHQHHSEDHPRVERILERGGERARREQDQHQRIVELEEEFDERAFPLARREPVSPHPFLPVPDLEQVQSAVAVRAQDLERFVDGQMMPMTFQKVLHGSASRRFSLPGARPETRADPPPGINDNSNRTKKPERPARCGRCTCARPRPRATAPARTIRKR
jgi:hypothetical protein